MNARAGWQAEKTPATVGGGIDPDAFQPGPKALALLRGRRIAEADLRESGGAFDLAQVTALLDISRQAVAERVRQGSLLAVPGPGGSRRYPAFQFTPWGVPAALRNILQALPSDDPWFCLNWLVNPSPQLAGRRPWDLVRQGEVEPVLAAARRALEMGT